MMGVCWMLVILLSCMSCHAQQNAKEPQLNIYVLTAQSHQTVFVPCPNVSAEDVTFELFKDNDVVYQLGTKSRNHDNQTQLDVQPNTNKRGQVDGFNVTATPTAGQTIYRCEGKIMYPPPFQTLHSTQKILILKHEDHCSCDKGISSETEANKESSWIWVLVVSLLSTYSLAVTIAALVIWFKLNGAEYQNDYINTKPKAPRNRRKKRGVQTPIPRYF